MYVLGRPGAGKPPAGLTVHRAMRPGATRLVCDDFAVAVRAGRGDPPATWWSFVKQLCFIGLDQCGAAWHADDGRNRSCVPFLYTLSRMLSAFRFQKVMRPSRDPRTRQS
ncbi:hypothetical protein GCM10010236_08240 [Streptomyces eurythermus]|nr:hypothetical protein GCM10010236_08240 [Streptomyces eurythermus]